MSNMNLVGAIEAYGEPILVGSYEAARTWSATAEEGPLFELIERLADHDLQQLSRALVAWAVRADGEIAVLEAGEHGLVALSWFTAEQGVSRDELVALAEFPRNPSELRTAILEPNGGDLVIMTSTFTLEAAATMAGKLVEVPMPRSPHLVSADRIDTPRGTAQRLAIEPL